MQKYLYVHPQQFHSILLNRSLAEFTHSLTWLVNNGAHEITLKGNCMFTIETSNTCMLCLIICGSMIALRQRVIRKKHCSSWRFTLRCVCWGPREKIIYKQLFFMFFIAIWSNGTYEEEILWKKRYHQVDNAATRIACQILLKE